MKLDRLSVQRFQCIEAAELELGPGLNVLFGPNDLGKSSLAWAIRAVLLLQHSSAAHERFVSWYGGGEPRVTLTLSDDDARYWRVTKSFGAGTAGRSVLESSKDGRSFTAEASGRQVDDKLRALLRWGLHRPGGKGTPHGLPVSFLTQVLLAEQDDVRKILFDSSLANDEDESGRLRLGEALGALAQDPLFKRVLDGAQLQVDRAFTATGRKKRSAGSPFIELAAKIEELQQQRDELARRVRETELAEAKVLELAGTRDTLARQLDEATDERARISARFAAQQRRDALRGQVRAHQDRVRSVEAQQQALERGQHDLAGHAAQLAAGDARLAAARLEVTAAETRATGARHAFDALSAASVAGDPALRDLEERERTAEEDHRDARHGVERAEQQLRRVSLVAHSLQDAHAARRRAAIASGALDEQGAVAVAQEARARQAVDDAKQHLRDTTSGDQARARELTRKELENRILQLQARRVDLARELERAEAVGALGEAAATAARQHDEAHAETARAREAVAAAAHELAKASDETAWLARLQLHGGLRDARRALDTAQKAAEAADRERTRAEALRREAAELRAGIRADLPASPAIEELRGLHEQLGRAEAGLSAVSVSIRPARPLAVRVTRDGTAGAVQTLDAPTALSAGHALVLEIADVGHIEVVGGDEAARSAAAALRARWASDGAPVLQAHHVETVLQLAELRRDSDRLISEAAARERDAERAEERARHQAPGELEALAARVAELEAELGTAELDALAAAFERLGTGWSQALKLRTTTLATAREALTRDLETRRTAVMRGDARLEALAVDAGARAQELATATAALGEPWRELGDRHRGGLAAIDGELAEADRAARALGTGSASEAQARAALQASEAALSGAQAAREAATAAAQGARDALVAASAVLEGARVQARELDTRGAWQVDAGDEVLALPTGSWRTELEAATAAEAQQKQRLAELRGQRAELAQQRAAALDQARASAAAADRAAREARQVLDELAEAARQDREQIAARQAEVSELRVQLAGVDLEQTHAAIAALERELAALGELGEPLDARDVERAASTVERAARQLRDAEDEIARSRGALEHVGGAIVRDQITELDQALQHHHELERRLEVEFDGWKLLAETLRSAESLEGQHLGRQLAGPVSQRFQQLTGGRYGSLELGAHLQTEGLHAAGAIREVKVLSAGTQDQLATLLRLCIAEQLNAAIVLDDHLSQSDPDRVAWFNDTLRTASQRLQIIVITCRPLELLAPAEMPAADESTRVSAAGLTRAIDLTKVIRRFASPVGATTPVAVSPR